MEFPGRAAVPPTRAAGRVPSVPSVRAVRAVRGVRGVDLRVAQGSIHAVVGPRGAGKTTLLNLLSGYLAPTEGQVLLAGEDVTGRQPDEFVRLGMGRAFRLTRLFDALTAAEYVALALGSRSDLGTSAVALLASVGLSGRAGAALGLLTPGERCALEIAVALAPGPRVLLLDEPTAGLAPDEVDQTIALLIHVAAGRTVLLVEHNLYAVRSIADTVTVLRAGEVVAEGAYDQVRSQLGG